MGFGILLFISFFCHIVAKLVSSGGGNWNTRQKTPCNPKYERLSHLPPGTTNQMRIPAGACKKVSSDLGLGGGFSRVLRIPPLLTTG